MEKVCCKGKARKRLANKTKISTQTKITRVLVLVDAISTYSNTSCKENHPRAPLLLLLIAKYEKLHILDEIKPEINLT